ncbi:MULTISPECIES: sensor histidine kinase [unclassified Streptomyces]|uniref:sensor histidine kinase n=1 Tax=unclassified Streptomyces TaxID=2593676 RepID=UPI0016612D7B|nr:MULTISPECIES: histidine kinase [unclassified Streptomyces]MBD0710153.1 two-component sensor histidine kinase [Streptomyces sp. CBMA291]MBD0715585.1 two-component sensor histidine kinase [Streptomyces sp. CBMA370]
MGYVTLPRPHRVDLLIALSGLACGLLLWAFGLFTTGGRLFDQRWAPLVPLVVVACTEAVRRILPQTALVVGTLAVVADQFTNGSLATVLMFTDVVYAAVVYGSPASARRVPYSTALVTIGVTVGFLVWWQNAYALLVGVLTGIVSFLPAVTGSIVRNHREAAEAARLRAEQTALLAEMDRTQAVVAERARMARELHDMVANHLSAIAIHSTAALSLDEPATTRQALTVIRENSVAGLAEMRRLIGLLRDSGGDTEPAAAPTLAGLDALIDQARANARPSGLVLVLDDTRESGAGLPAPVELAAYRIVQESLTNALKHAAPGEVRVTLTRGGDALAVEVTSPYGQRPGPTAPGSGAGLVGMRERVALLGGRFEAGPVADGKGHGGWRVRAELPVDANDEEWA